jgi:glucose-6-phosphate 1-epimerase
VYNFDMSDSATLVADLRKRFATPGVTFEPGQGGLARVSVATPAADAHVYLHGAHVTHYQPRGRRPVLFMSGSSHFAPGKPIRGGVPVILPWFGANAKDAKAPAHGFARTQAWNLREVKRREGDGAVNVSLSLRPSPASHALWPHEFEATFDVTVGAALEMALHVRNTGASAFTFEEALHTYLAVNDVRKVTVEGLAGRQYIDKVDGAKRKTQPPGAMRIEGETDRVYLNTPDTVTVNEQTPGGRRLSVWKQNSAAIVVWNPWVAKAAAMADFGDDEWPGMICVETANVADHAVTLAPGQSHVMRAVVRVA